MKLQVKIGAIIKEIREEEKLTQEQLAQKSGLNRTFIIHVEKGRRNISIQSLAKVLSGLDITFTKFFKKGGL